MPLAARGPIHRPTQHGRAVVRARVGTRGRVRAMVRARPRVRINARAWARGRARARVRVWGGYVPTTVTRLVRCDKRV